MQSTIIFFFLTALFSPILAQSQGTNPYERSVITDPSVSRRCQKLLKDRQEKISLKQRLEALIVRNEKLQKKTPPQKKSVKKKLVNNYKRLQNEHRLATMKIQNMEENIVRKGCPGISL